MNRIKFFTCVLIFVSFTPVCFGQKLHLGLNYGIGTQSIFPFNSGSYIYDIHYLKLHLGLPFKKNDKWSMSWQIEPSYFSATHQLTNRWYKLDERDDIYARKIDQFSEPKKIREYVLNIGLEIARQIGSHFTIYGLTSIGPMYSDTETERLARGFAFSDILGIGITYQFSVLRIGMRGSIRHVSNANLKFPNNGHNSSNLELTIAYLIKGK